LFAVMVKVYGVPLVSPPTTVYTAFPLVAQRKS
jgi:hypothetical protein